jgi:flagellar protein FlaJ
MFFWTFTGTITSFLISLLLFSSFSTTLGLNVSFAVLVVNAFLICAVTGAGIFLTFMYYPSYVASNAKIKLEKNLVYISNYMAILSGAGATPGETFNSFIKNGKTFGIQDSARSVVKNIELLGSDLITSLDEESKLTPSKDYSGFLQGYIATMQTGGDIHDYLLGMSNKFMESRRQQLKKMIDQLGLAGEIYISALVAFPLIMITLLSIMGLFGGEVMAGLSAPMIMTLMTYILVPVLAVGVLIFIDSIMTSW